MSISNKKIASSIMWKSLEKTVIQISRLVMEIIMARILLPDDYGTFALLLTFVTISNIIIEGGLGTALIQTEEIDYKKDPSTVLLILMFISMAVYCLLFFLAGPIESYYKIDNLGYYLRIIAIAMFPTALNSVQNSLAMREMKFRLIFYANATGLIISSVIGIIVAVQGYGVWSLIIQFFIQILVSCIIMWCSLKWRPSLDFSFTRGRRLFGFGWKLMVANLINRGYAEIYNLVIARVFNATTLGYYNRAKIFPAALEHGLSSIISTVMLPVFSKVQNNTEEINRKIQYYIRYTFFVMAPVFLGIIAAGDNIIVVLLTEKWINVAPIMKLLCVGIMFRPISSINITAINAIGRSDIVLRLEIIKRFIGLVILAISINFGIVVVAGGLSLAYILDMLLNCHQNKVLINFSFFDLMRSIFPSLVSAVIMAICVIQVERLNIMNIYCNLIVQICVGILSYTVISLVINRKVLLGILKGLRLLIRR